MEEESSSPILVYTKSVYILNKTNVFKAAFVSNFTVGAHCCAPLRTPNTNTIWGNSLRILSDSVLHLFFFTMAASDPSSSKTYSVRNQTLRRRLSVRRNR